MTSLTKASSSSSFRSSSRYSCSSISSVQTEGSSGTDPFFQSFRSRGSQTLFGDDPLSSTVFSDHLREGPLSSTAFSNHPKGPYLPHQGHLEGSFSSYGGDLSTFGDRDSFGSCRSERESVGGFQGDLRGYQGDGSHGDEASSGGPTTLGTVQDVGDSYHLSVDVSQFEPHDIVVMAFNRSVVIHAEKVGDDGTARDKFTHKSLLPEDMDPLSVCGTLTADGTLLVSVRRNTKSLSSGTST
ncbi:uncharacterized protein [Hoplias malabaricus]|uniref:uncharacterized protein n=1 Tax=Hoplias malabaricus TaxID=27720 RepID=UPI003462D32C